MTRPYLHRIIFWHAHKFEEITDEMSDAITKLENYTSHEEVARLRRLLRELRGEEE